MKKYKVIALSVGGGGKKIYNSGDIVESRNFPNSNIDQLVEKGFLQEIVEEPTKEPEKPTGKPEGNLEDGETGDNSDSNNDGKIDIEEVTKKKITEDLKAAGVPFDPTSSKVDLYNIWSNLKKGDSKE